MTIQYFSASQIQRFRRCPQSWYNTYVLGQREPETEAQRIGKEIHTQMEEYWLHDMQPTHRLAVALMNGLPFRPDSPEVRTFAVEMDTESGGFQLAGVPMRGFVDLQVVDGDRNLVILDYKTTSDWKWAKGAEALRVDPQLNLYAAWAFYTYPHLQAVTVGHHVVNKKTAETRWTPVVRTRDEVREYCAGIADTLREMIAVSELAPDAVARNEDACGDFGGCSFRGSCFAATSRFAALASDAPPAPTRTQAAAPATTANPDRLAALRARRDARRLAPAAAAQEAPEAPAPPTCAFLPPDASPDLEPEPLDTRPVGDVLPKGAVTGAEARGIHTVADLQTFLAFGGELRDIAGIGPKAVDKIAAELRTISTLWPSARLRLRRALDVYAVDPNADAAHLPRVRTLRGAL